MPHEHLLDCPLSPAEVFNADAKGVRSADVVITLLDGTEVDDGTACEMNLFVSSCIEAHGSIHADTDQALAAVEALAAHLSGPPSDGG